MNEIERAMETIKHVSDLDTKYHLNISNYDLLIAIEALREKQERENPQPLTLEEFISIKNTPIYITPENGWYLKTNDGLIDQYGEASEMEEWNFETYGQFWLAYLTKPTADES